MKENVWSKPMTKPPNSLDPGHIEGQNPATPERVLGHTAFARGENNANEETLGGRPAFVFVSGKQAAVTLDSSGENLPAPSGPAPWKLDKYFTLGVRDASAIDRNPETIIRAIAAQGYYLWRTDHAVGGEGTSQ